MTFSFYFILKKSMVRILAGSREDPSRVETRAVNDREIRPMIAKILA
jgi:hypothetical protein